MYKQNVSHYVAILYAQYVYTIYGKTETLNKKN